jgi:hypothetical protein
LGLSVISLVSASQPRIEVRLLIYRKRPISFGALIALRTVTVYKPKCGQTNQNLFSRDF